MSSNEEIEPCIQEAKPHVSLGRVKAMVQETVVGTVPDTLTEAKCQVAHLQAIIDAMGAPGEQPDDAIRPGMVVSIVSGGPIMGVESVVDGDAVCTWWGDEDGTGAYGYQQMVFRSAVLKEIGGTLLPEPVGACTVYAMGDECVVARDEAEDKRFYVEDQDTEDADAEIKAMANEAYERRTAQYSAKPAVADVSGPGPGAFLANLPIGAAVFVDSDSVLHYTRGETVHSGNTLSAMMAQVFKHGG